MLHFSVPFTHSSSSEDSASPSACPAYVCSLSSRPVVAAAGLGVGALSTVVVAQSAPQERRVCPGRPRRPHTAGFCAQVDKHLPASVRREPLRELKTKPCDFEVLPSAGALGPGQRCNVRVRFTPTEQVRLVGVTLRRSGGTVW